MNNYQPYCAMCRNYTHRFSEKSQRYFSYCRLKKRWLVSAFQEPCYQFNSYEKKIPR